MCLTQQAARSHAASIVQTAWGDRADGQKITRELYCVQGAPDSSLANPMLQPSAPEENTERCTQDVDTNVDG